MLPSKSENFGISVLEAMTAGLAVMISPEVALADTIKQHKIGYVVERSEEAFSNEINELLQGISALSQTGDRAQSFTKQNYDWSKIAAKLVSLYETPTN